jgi:hypothetical protein
MITRTRTRTETGEIRYIDSDKARNIHPGTIIRPFGGETFEVWQAEHYAYGESRFWNFREEMIFLGSDTRVEILDHFNI